MFIYIQINIQANKVHNIRSQQTNIAPKTSTIWLQLQRQKQLSS